MTLFGQTSQLKTVQLNDAAGIDTFVIKDSDGFPIFKVWSNGDYGFKGNVRRT